MPRLNKQYFFYSNPVSGLKFSTKKLRSKIYRLDKLSCEGINFLIPFLKEISSSEFESVIDALLKKCFYVNRTFSDAVDFLSIWLIKSPETLLQKLKKNELKEFFYKTEYDKDGYEWSFPKLLHAFLPVIEREDLNPNLVMSYLFDNFGFLSMPKVFIWMVIGYDKLGQRLEEIPKVFHEPLFKKMTYLYHRENNLGPRSNSLVRLYKSERESLKKLKEAAVMPWYDNNTSSKRLTCIDKIASYPKLG